MTILETTDRVANTLARADALLLALDGATLPDEQANALIFLAGDLRDYVAKLSADLEASRKA
jgi:hypothetical protein